MTKADVDYVISRGWRRVACNWAFDLDPEADVLCWADQRWYLWARKELHRHKGKYKIAWRSGPPTPGVTIRQLRHHSSPPAISSDPGMIVAGNTGQGAINVAYLFGASRILLLGFDMKMVAGHHNWHSKHKGPTSAKRYTDVFGPAIAKAGAVLKAKNVQVINCTPDSALKCFPMMRLRDIDPIVAMAHNDDGAREFFPQPEPLSAPEPPPAKLAMTFQEWADQNGIMQGTRDQQICQSAWAASERAILASILDVQIKQREESAG